MVCDGTGGRRLLFFFHEKRAMKNETQNFRKNALRARRMMTIEQRENASQIICKKLTSCREFHAAKLIACYLPMRDEVDTRNIIDRAWRANKRIFVPIVRNKHEMLFSEIRPNTTLNRNSMGIWEPADGEIISARELQFVVTPTVAFDNKRNRIGMGGGYYDRCFSHLRHRQQWLKPKLAGVAFNCQNVEEITPNTWDIRLYRIFTE